MPLAGDHLRSRAVAAVMMQRLLPILFVYEDVEAATKFVHKHQGVSFDAAGFPASNDGQCKTPWKTSKILSST